LRDYAIKGFFCIHRVAVGSIRWIEELSEEVERWSESGVSGAGATILLHAVHVLQQRAEEPIGS